MKNIKIKEVNTKSDLNKFISVPDKLYKGNKFRAPQLHSFEKQSLHKHKNPAFDFCEAKYWLAYKGNKIVGRIAGIITELTYRNRVFTVSSSNIFFCSVATSS